jgi:geranylgeranyl pyrophosphate synthase
MTTLLTLKKEIQNELNAVNDFIQSTLLSADTKTLNDIYTHTLNTQGKQIRASIILLISKITHGINDHTKKLAAGIELIHLASLIHDDIIDNADIRRNIETVHKKFNVNNGIISGVHCYALALKLITSIRNIDIVSIISDSVIDLCEGECVQVNERFNFNISEPEYWRIVNKKTSALFKASCICSGHLNQLNETDIHHLALFGELLGDIFQLTDDYLDLFDKKNQLSKKVMQDLAIGDISLPILLAAKKANETGREIETILATHKNDIATTIKNQITARKTTAESNINALSFNAPQLIQILDIVTKRVA